MKQHHANEILGRLWRLARQKPAAALGEPLVLSPGLATRIVARWAEKSARAAAWRRWERITAAAFVVALLVCGAAAWQRPKPLVAQAEDDLLLTLFHARSVPAEEFPF